jgi:16S rRNA (uracil1498-N3)-methyltransferase
MLEPDASSTLFTAAGTAESITLLVGPEGGLSSLEADIAARSGFTPCRLGPRILRTETASLAAIAALQAIAGDFA